MFFALDENDNRVNAEDGEFKNCICPACRKPVRQRRGDTNRHHFAHIKKESTCPFEYNKDYINMSEWHIRMQEYFPKDEREFVFSDKETGEKHITDVYIKEANTVLEFQYSSLKKKEFLDRTMFHINEGRRIVWLFDESWKDADEESYNKKYYRNGKLTKANDWRIEEPYKSRCFRWLYRRKYVEEWQPVYQPNYSVCIYTGTEGDVFHRIVSINADLIILSLHDITMSKELNVEEFFLEENYFQEDTAPEIFDGSEDNQEPVLTIEVARKLHDEAVERLEREDYWRALLEYTDSVGGK